MCRGRTGVGNVSALIRQRTRKKKKKRSWLQRVASQWQAMASGATSVEYVVHPRRLSATVTLMPPLHPDHQWDVLPWCAWWRSMEADGLLVSAVLAPDRIDTRVRRKSPHGKDHEISRLFEVTPSECVPLGPAEERASWLAGLVGEWTWKRTARSAQGGETWEAGGLVVPFAWHWLEAIRKQFGTAVRSMIWWPHRHRLQVTFSA